MLRSVIAILLAVSLTFAADFTQTVKKSIDASHLKKVAVFSTNGNISIKGGESNQILVTATKSVKGSESEKDRLLKSLEINMEESDGQLTIKVKRLRKSKGFFSWLFDLGLREYRVDFDLIVPAHLKVKAHSTNGKIQVHNFTGELELATTNGEIQAIKVKNVRELHSTNGNVDVDFASLPETKEEIEITTTNGEINLIVPQETQFNVKAFTTNGRVDYTLQHAGKLSKSRGHLEIINGPDLLTLFLKTTNGDISIHSR